jgi:RNase adapter protein RapZ
MKIRIISYGHKYYEELGEPAPYHDFLFSLRDLANPFWIPELKGFHGLEPKIIEFFGKDPGTQDRLTKVTKLIEDFIQDFSKNQNRDESSSLTFAFKCTGGKHRSVYFAQSVFDHLRKQIDKVSNERKIELEVEHVDLPRYISSELSK